MNTYTHLADAAVSIAAPTGAVFEYLDHQEKLSSHMSRRSWMMLGSTMDLYMDEQRTQAVGSRFGLSGRILGIPLSADEVVVSRRPPVHKAWETVGIVHLWVIGPYRMGFDLTPEPGGTSLRVYIEYRLPERGFPWLLGRLFGGVYANWCTRQMAVDARRHFAGTGTAHRSLPA